MLNTYMYTAIAMTPVASYAISVRDGIALEEALALSAMFVIALAAISVISFRR